MNRGKSLSVVNFVALFCLTLFLAFGAGARFAGADDAAVEANERGYQISAHDLDVKLDVAGHSISAVDRLSVKLTKKGIKQVAFMLNKNLKVKSLRIQGDENPVVWEQANAFHNIQKITAGLPDNVGDELTIEVEYEGEIYDPVITAQELGHLRGDVTAGLISEKGVYLAASTHWYPVISNELSMFNIRASIADPFRIVTQGELLERKVEAGQSISVWKSHVPADGLALVGGKYVINTRTVDGIKVSSYFFAEDASMSGLFLDAAEEYLKIYSDLLGKYPYKKFDVVENFFSTGYGMPSYTLLGNYVIKRGKGSLHPGYLDHEIVHSWFGNYVFNDAIKGNWVEALTTYCANYYYKELMLGHNEALEHRENASLKYSIRVPKNKDYPLKKFVTKTAPYDNEIGYTKGSMVFHQLRQTIGDDKFFKGLKELVKRFGGKFAEWADLQAVFEDVSETELGWFFTQWVEASGAPELLLSNVAFAPADKGYIIKGDVIQIGRVYNLALPVHINFGSREKVIEFKTNEKIKQLQIGVSELPLSINIDPEYHLFRRLPNVDISPCLNAVLEDDSKYYIYPEKGTEAEKKIYQGLANSASQRTGGKSVSDSEVTEEMLESSLFIAGGAMNNPLCKQFYDLLPGNIVLGDGFFSFNGEEFKGPEYSALFTVRNPFNDSRYVTTYFGLSPEAVSRARYIFFYGWNGYVVFKNGRPVKRGYFKNKHLYTNINFVDSLTLPIRTENISHHLKYLASDMFEGRYAGSNGDLLARTYIKRKFAKYNIPPAIVTGSNKYEQEVNIVLTDLKNFTCEFKNKNKSVNAGAIAVPFNFSPAGKYSSEVFMAGYGISGETYDDYKGVEDAIKDKTVAIFDGEPDFLNKDGGGDEIELLFNKINKAQKLGAKALFIISTKEQAKKYAPYLTYMSRVPDSIAEKIKRKKDKGSFSSLEMEVSGAVSRCKKPGFYIEIPVALIIEGGPDYEKVEKRLQLSKIKKKIEKKKVPAGKYLKGLTANMAIEYKISTVETNNIIAVLKGNDPVKKYEMVVIGAHYDHLGMDEKGNIFNGADDNASGVAAMLEVANALYEVRDRLKRTVLFVAFGAEEWGLIGSQAFVDTRKLSSTEKIIAMFNIDSIGRGDTSKYWLIGGSVYPPIANLVNKYSAELGLVEGDNIDKYAFKYGSDHYPFHMKGIPAVDLFSSNYRELHNINDTIENVNAEKITNLSKLVFISIFDLLTR